MEYLKILAATFAAILFLFILTKMMGNRQISQLSLFDYIISITIGNIAAEMATDPNRGELGPALAMLVMALAAVGISILSNKSLKFRQFVTGKPLLLYQDGIFYERNMKLAKLDLSEFLIACRQGGFFNLADVQMVQLEPIGKLSIMPKAYARPATPADFGQMPQKETPAMNVVMDGVVIHENLETFGKNETWLKNQLSAQGVKHMQEVFLATVDNQSNLSVYNTRRR